MDKKLLNLILECFDNIEQMTKNNGEIAQYNRQQFINTAIKIRKEYLDKEV